MVLYYLYDVIVRCFVLCLELLFSTGSGHRFYFACSVVLDQFCRRARPYSLKIAKGMELKSFENFSLNKRFLWGDMPSTRIDGE